MPASRISIIVFGLLLALTAAVACSAAGGGERSAAGGFGDDGAVQAAPAAKAVVATVVVEKVVVEREVAEKALPPAAPTPAPAPALALASLKATGDGERSAGIDRELVLAAAERRIIVRTVDMALQVEQVSRAMGAISDIARDSGGWVVSSDRSEKNRGSMSVRVPAEGLNSALDSIRAVAAKVERESSTSQDFTNEYTDTSARLRNLESTEEALRALLDRADKVEDAVRVQTELTRTQSEIEVLQGRLKLLEQTSAFSLVAVRLSAVPFELVVDAGPDQSVAVGRAARFRATFAPPEGIKNFTAAWDFGDGSPPLTVNRTAPTLKEGTLITAPVSHIYGDDVDSPFIVTVEISGSGEGGLAEGDHTLIATVSRIPAIEVFAGEPITTQEGDSTQFSGSFTRPEGIEQLAFEWDFGDGSAPVTGELGPGVTAASASHVYPNHRPFPFTATLTMTGQTAAGEAEGAATVQVFVSESPGWVIVGIEPGATGRSAVRLLSGAFFYGVRGLIWLGILSPLWIPLGALVFFGYRRHRGSRPC